MKKTGELYLVATPIGNLDDLSFRAKKVLEKAEIIFCEDTRRFQKLVKGRKIVPLAKIFSFFKEKEAKVTAQALEFLRQGKRVALVSDGGTPLIADPGLDLVRACQDWDIKIIPVPGPAAFLLALISSSFPVQPFSFLGFLPKKAGKRKKVFKECQQVAEKSAIKTFVFYESPHRLLFTLKIFKEVLGNKQIFLALELTKLHENHQLQKVEDLIQLYEEKKPKGEITGVFYLPEP